MNGRGRRVRFPCDNRQVSRVLKFVVMAVALGAALWFYQPTRLGLLVLAGRSQGCPWRQALQSGDNAARQIELKDRILKEIHEVEKDPAGFHLWQTPKARYWMPAGSDFVLPWNLAARHSGDPRAYEQGGALVRPALLPPLHGDPRTLG